MLKTDMKEMLFPSHRMDERYEVLMKITSLIVKSCRVGSGYFGTI